MTTKLISFQLCPCGNDVAPQRVQVNIPYQFQQIGLFLAQDRFVAVLKEMPASVVFPIEGDGVPREKFSHDTRNRGTSRPEQQVYMVGHQDSGRGCRLREDLAESFDEIPPVLIGAEYFPTLDATTRYMV